MKVITFVKNSKSNKPIKFYRLKIVKRVKCYFIITKILKLYMVI